MLTCKYCNKELKNNNSLAQHEIRCSKNEQRVAVGFTSSTAKTSSSGKNFSKMVKINNARKYKDEDVFVENSTYPRKDIKKRLITNNIVEYKCDCCDLGPEWNGKILTLQLDHINGVNNDHRKENLRFLCPNCHTQQDTYAAKNRFNDKRQPKKY